MDDKIGMKPSRTIGIPIPHITSTRPRNCYIFILVSRKLAWHDTITSESENLLENLRSNKNFKNTERKNNFKVEKVGCKNSVNWNHTNSIINWTKKDSDFIHVDPKHTESNQPILENLKNIGSIHD